MGSFFIAIYNYFERHRGVMWFAAITSFLLAGFFASRVSIEEDITRILPREQKLDKLMQTMQDSRFSDVLTVTFSQKDTTHEAQPDSLTAFADAFTDIAAGKLKPYINKVKGRADDSTALNLLQSVQADLPLFLGSTDYDSVDALLSPDRIKKSLTYDYNTLISPAGLVMKKIIQDDPVGISFIGIKKLRKLGAQYDIYDGYVMTKDHRNLQMFVTPAYHANATGRNAKFFKELDATFDSLQRQFPGVAASYFGAAAVSAGNAMQIRTDTMLTQGVTVLLLVLFIGFYFRKKRAPVLIMVPVLFGGLFSLAVIYFIAGHISVVALGAGSIVLGIAVNYSLHIFNHHRHLPDMRGVIADVASPMTIGSFTTIGGFLCLLLVPSPLLNDMGLFAAFSLVGATLFSLIFLPHWITGGSSNAVENSHIHKHSWLDKLSEYHPERNKYLIAGIFLLTLVFLFTAQKVGFENDMLKMNYMSPKLQEAEKKLNAINAYTAQSIYLIADGKSLDEALAANDHIAPILRALQLQGVIKSTAGVGDLLLSQREQYDRIERWNTFWASRKDYLLDTLKALGAAYRFRPAAFNQFEQLLNKQFSVTPPRQTQMFRTGMLNDFIVEKRGSVSLVTLIKADPKQKDVLYKALGNQPGITVLDRQYATNRLVGEINNEFNNIAWMTSLLVFLALFISYGRIELTLITFIPMLISWVWILGIMGIFSIKFNIVNIILSTFIFGLGDDYSIFIMDGLLQQYKTGKQHISSFKSSIFLSAITTVLGLGILIFAKHPSLRSIAIISITGICCVVLTSQVLIPFFFNWLITNRVKKGFAPWTFSGWLKTVFSFTYFTLGSFIVALAGFVLIKLNPFNKEKSKYLYHVVLAKFAWTLVHIMANVKKTCINPQKEDFSKPAVVISNHQSVLDILMSTSLSPKVILLTNQWVYRSPVFGAVVRLADYYPVAEGVEDSLDLLRGKVKQGYSIVIYPEGTRSVTGDIKRFHKGAFYIAEQLGLDVLPILIHGTAHALTKGDFLLKDGEITVKFLPRILPNNASWGEGYTERAKTIAKYFRREYEQLRAERETPRYFRGLLIYNYIYKGPILEWYMRVKTAMEHNYEIFDRLLPKHGTILDIGCGYGFMDYMLHFISRERTITGLDFDEEKIATAQNNFSRTEQLNFVCADVAKYEIGQYDAYIISDVLHYLQPDEQEAVLRQCILHLTDDGIIVIRDGDADLKARHKGTRFSEFLSTKAIGFNKTSNPLSFFSSSRIRDIAAKYGASVEQIDSTKYTSNIIFVLKKITAPAYARV